MGKIISFYLKRMLANSQHQEQSLEVNADLIDNVNEKWKKQRERSDTLKAVIKMLWTISTSKWNENGRFQKSNTMKQIWKDYQSVVLFLMQNFHSQLYKGDQKWRNI